ncbi:MULTISPECIES: NAD(P)/FAD-dependent oxidoreductase [Paenibacillus]|uniref:Pyridine nucleotide-disulfide oxidoreductase n=2 Tax=Paenibacillus TaxID=44249 RepID=A0ABX2Z7C2_PAEPO|nr:MULTISPECIES: NAD(P)/FAD-dependent oxidoreductase [Paenibacillus]MBP1178004.1 thioredoxin reductase [Paenibacillus sp. PvR133]MCP3746153.1 NAD(P)/FAD-dependent oxidoreductase [Paenibacillus sp. A3M_27_13]MDR6779786.1 thioredoxin reductase [Paenibacillus peoriae]ODA06622.1 pyridine nucleotide-disulfide oxidoreductase [Paenibacillus polymyxa]OME70986.1 pyridine nucleotide-disulfide oxidoreductase [Paenibacillus peoriae]
MLYDCAIIGGGPAGLNAALVLGRARRNVALIDNNRPRNAVTHASHGFITRDGVTPAEFRRVAYEEVLRYPSVHHLQTEVVSITKNESGFEVLDSSGLRVQARKLILATGVKEIFPEIEGFYPLYGKSLFNCPYCDGWELRDQPLVLVSESAAIYHTAKLLLNWSKDLIVCTNGHASLSEEQKERLQSKGIVVMEQPVSAFIGHNGQLEHVRFTDGTQVPRVGGFVSPQFVQSTPFGERLGCERTESGGIKTDEAGRTSIPGVYAAGDSSYFMPSQLIFAAADGSRTAASVNMDLTEEDFSE